MSPIRAILFDFDGVIVHTAPIVKRALWYFFREKGFSIVEEDFETDNYVSKSLEQVCECLFQKYALALDINELRSGIWDTQLALMKEGLVSDPDLFVLLKLCQHNNIAIAIGSNSIRSRIEWIVNMMGLSSYFHTIIGAGDVSSHKPDPEVWTSAASQLGVSHSECLVVEDGFPGLVGAGLCGMQGLYYHRFTSPDRQCLDLSKYHTDTFSDIIKLLTGLPSCND